MKEERSITRDFLGREKSFVEDLGNVAKDLTPYAQGNLLTLGRNAADVDAAVPMIAFLRNAVAASCATGILLRNIMPLEEIRQEVGRCIQACHNYNSAVGRYVQDTMLLLLTMHRNYITKLVCSTKWQPIRKTSIESSTSVRNKSFR